ncbi:MAG: endonuclease/exonuclease/phosphatase family protein [Pseudomonadota bacterium]
MTDAWWLRRLAGLAAAGTLVLVLANVAALGAAFSPWLDLATHFRPHYAACALLGALVLTLARYWRWGGLAIAVFVFNAALLWPYLDPMMLREARAAANDLPTSVARLRVLHANVLTSNVDHDALLARIRATEPNIVLLQEVDQAWLDALADLRTAFPHRLELPRTDNFGIAAYSRWPRTELQRVDLTPDGPPAIALQIPTQVGRVHVLSLHPVPPVGRAYSDLRNRQLAAAAAMMARWPDTKLAVGDLNITPWSPHFRTFIDTAGLRDARHWQGLHASWPASLPWLAIPIDHALPGDRLRTDRFESAWLSGSDHATLFTTWELLP